MIIIKATLGEGLLDLHVEGHELNAEGGAVCSAVSVAIQTAVAILEGFAERWPRVIEMTITERTPR